MARITFSVNAQVCLPTNVKFTFDFDSDDLAEKLDDPDTGYCIEDPDDLFECLDATGHLVSVDRVMIQDPLGRSSVWEHTDDSTNYEISQRFAQKLVEQLKEKGITIDALKALEKNLEEGDT